MTTTYSFDAAAARLRLGRNTLMRKLRELGLLTPDNMPAGRERSGPHFRVRQGVYQHPITGWTNYSRTEVTEQGLAYIARLLKHTPKPRPSASEKKESKAMSQQPARSILPTGTLHDAGELIVITPDGERIHHRAAMVLVFDTAENLQRAINTQRCAYQIRRDIPEEQLHPVLAAQRG